MSDTLKVLGQQAPAGTPETILYTVPTATQTTISSIVVCNRSGSGVTYRVSVAVSGATTSNKDYLFYDKALAANSSDTIVIGITVTETDKINVYASDGNLSFTAFGCETTEE